MQEYYWHIELYSGEIIKVKPDADRIQAIQAMIASQEGAITTPNRSIIIKDVRDFRLSDEMVIDQKLLEDGLRAFGEAMYTKDGAVKARYVKKSVPRRKYEAYYSKIPAYHVIGENDSFTIIAFVMCLDTIDWNRVQKLTEDEELMMARMNKRKVHA